MGNGFTQATHNTKYKIGMAVQIDVNRDENYFEGEIVDKTVDVIFVIFDNLDAIRTYKIGSDWDRIKIKH